MSWAIFAPRGLLTNLAFGFFVATAGLAAAAVSSSVSWAASLDDARAADKATDVGDFDLAIALYEKALASGDLSQNNQAAVFFNRGGVYLNMGRIEDAIQDFTQAVLLKPTHQRAWASRGIALRAINRSAQAIADFTEALDVGTPDDSEVYNLRGQAYRDVGQYDEAIADFNTALQLHTNWAFATRNRARTNFYKGDFTTAAADFDAAFNIEKDPYTSIWRYLSMARAGQEDSGRRSLARSTRRLREELWPAPIVRMFLGEQTPNSVLELARDPEDPERSAALATEAMFYIGQLFLLRGDSKQAAAFFDRVMELGVTNFFEYDGARVELQRIGR